MDTKATYLVVDDETGAIAAVLRPGIDQTTGAPTSYYWMAEGAVGHIGRGYTLYWTAST